MSTRFQVSRIQNIIQSERRCFLFPEFRCVSIHPFLRLCVVEVPEKYSIALSSHSPTGQQRRLEPELIIATLIKTWLSVAEKTVTLTFSVDHNICEADNRKQ